MLTHTSQTENSYQYNSYHFSTRVKRNRTTAYLFVPCGLYFYCSQSSCFIFMNYLSFEQKC